MSDTYVTLHGWVGGDVNFRTPQGVSVASFRVASTPRLKKAGDWVDGDTTWYSVTVWRHLADNVHASVQKGDAVIVHGRLRTDSWKREDGQVNSTLAIEASLVGHDLSRGTSAFVRTPRPEPRNEAEVEQEVAEMHQQMIDEDSPRVDGWGNPVDPPDAAEDGEAGVGVGDPGRGVPAA
jgi:single-strand DNA-binding protein